MKKINKSEYFDNLFDSSINMETAKVLNTAPRRINKLPISIKKNKNCLGEPFVCLE
jgi:hypothetical protein